MRDWVSTTAGRATRLTIGLLGVITASLTLMVAPTVENGSWALVLTGVALAATSGRAAREPNLTRLGAVIANLLLIPLLAFLG